MRVGDADELIERVVQRRRGVPLLLILGALRTPRHRVQLDIRLYGRNVRFPVTCSRERRLAEERSQRAVLPRRRRVAI